ncbi:MAG: hypothetical protein COB02_11475 [Candidatus Cloacimonadota bacterium]|nr:MAG: hypothetical protein COB02_11475 [Candidatus Cloacimonadota bacterium]
MKLQTLLIPKCNWIFCFAYILISNSFANEYNLDFLKESLRKNHLQLESSSLQIKSLKLQAKSEGRLKNPMVKLGVFPKEVATKNGNMKYKFGVSQVLPPKSQLFFKKQIVLGLVSIEELKKEKLLQGLLLKLEKTYFLYNFLFEKKLVLEENLHLINSWIKLWETHYSTHDFQYQRLIQLQIDAREIKDKIRSVHQKIPVVLEELKELAWLDLDSIKLSKSLKKVSKIDLILGLDSNIDLLIIDANQKKKKSQIKFENSFFKPKYVVSSEWTMIDANGLGQNQGDDAWMISLGMELVLDKNKIKNRVSSKKVQFKSLQTKRSFKQRSLKVKWNTISYQVNDARAQYQLIKDDLIPRTKEALESIQTNYMTQNKGIDFFSLLNHLRKLLKLSLNMKIQYKNYFQAYAEQKSILGIIGEN